MRLYTRVGATALDHPQFGHFEPDEQGGFDFPDDLSDELHRHHTHGKPNWENDVERQHRLMQEELERRKDPATLLSVVEQLMRAATNASAVAEAPTTPPEPRAPRARKSAASKPKPTE